MSRERALSVVVPVYNVEQYLPKCLDSIIHQTFRNLEIILVDDGSTDNSGIICDEYALIDERILVIHQENAGPSNARFNGLKKTSHEYVTFVDSDDFIADTMYEVLLSKICEFKADLVVCNFVKYWNDDKMEKNPERPPEEYYGESFIIKELVPNFVNRKGSIYLNNSMCNKIFRKDLLFPILEKLGKCSFHFAEDFAVVFLYILRIKSFVTTNEYYYFYRQRESAVIPQYLRDPFFLDKLYELYTFLREEFSESEYKDMLIKQLECFFALSSGGVLRKYGMTLQDLVPCRQFLFPFDRVEKRSRIILYGAGIVGQQYYEQIKQLDYCNIVCWVDKKYQKYETKKVEPISRILATQFDYVVIANAKEKIKAEITRDLETMGIEKECIV